MDLKDKVAVITGGSKGIGKAIAENLAMQGCDVVITARSGVDLEKAEREISRIGRKVMPVALDIRNSKEVERLALTVEASFGPPSILINNAGIGTFAEVRNMRDEDFRAVLETNLFGVFYCSRTFLPGMIERKEGHIINISSLASKNPFAGASAYCASKAALNAFAECMMLEVRHHNVKVTTICPGSVKTEFGSGLSEEKSWALTSQDVADVVLEVLQTSPGSLVSLVDLRPLKPQKK
ncbi:MAG TPA: SDR family NAD(P)-dependent oxidoreductase [Acidobacteriota bacterium]|jgi:NAD(P)-dependent dehydrogenase (short-subunit alcohol dehydrogenase family)|nr:SDR family NAD(P)-dependent oxidoreductase [Acidobacteriota bacterium]